MKYLDLLDHVLSKGTRKSDRTGTGTPSILIPDEIQAQRGFPAMTNKKLYLKSIIHEFLVYLEHPTRHSRQTASDMG